jgi:hypothetical protein
MSHLNLLAKPFIPKRKSYTEEDFEALQKELNEETQKRMISDKEYSVLLEQFKTYVESNEKMKLDYKKQLDVKNIKINALEDIRDVLYQQITDLHFMIETLKEQIRKHESEKTSLHEELTKNYSMIKEEQAKCMQKEIEIQQLKAGMMSFYQQHAHNYPYYYQYRTYPQ